jgi:hypothetical protein
MAIDWSMRVNTRVEELAVQGHFGGTLGLDADAHHRLDGLHRVLAAAVSADSITASVPSSTALATSDTSARVGTGLGSSIPSSAWR